MKKYVTYVCLFLIVLILVPTKTYAITLGEYEKKVDKYKKEIENTKKAINKTEAQIEKSNQEINNIKKEMKKLANEVEKLNEEIANGKIEIVEKGKQTKQLFEYLQISSGDNAYLEYAFGAETTTDLIYRMSIVEQMTEYNEQMIKEIENMIEGNNKREEQIVKINKNLTKNQLEIQKKVLDLGEEKIGLEEGGVTSAGQLKIYQDLVNSYKKLGCKSSDVIGVDCANSGSAGVFKKPVSKGYITSEFGPRWGGFHQGIDMSNGTPYSTKIYPVANGTIVAKYIDYYGALVIMMEHYDTVTRKWYTSTYAHMSKYASGLYVGKYLSSSDYIGYMGSTGHSTGPHLHLEIADCRIYKDDKCSNWSKYSSYLKKRYNQGYKGPRGLIVFPNGSRSWYQR